MASLISWLCCTTAAERAHAFDRFELQGRDLREQLFEYCELASRKLLVCANYNLLRVSNSFPVLLAHASVLKASWLSGKTRHSVPLTSAWIAMKIEQGKAEKRL